MSGKLSLSVSDLVSSSDAEKNLVECGLDARKIKLFSNVCTTVDIG